MASTYDYTFQCAALQDILHAQSGPADNVVVTRWQGSEGVSRLYRFDVTLAVKQSGVALEKLLNQPVTLTARAPDGSTRAWSGIVTQGVEQGRDETYYYYQLVLEPRMARLRNMHWSDIYLQRDLGDLIKQLLGYAGLDQPYSGESAPYDYRIAATQLTQTQADFTCQFEETCLDFLMRKLEHYGVYFWFEQGSNQESVVFANDVTQQPPTADIAVYYPKGTVDPDAHEIAITQLNRRVALSPGVVVLHDTPEQGNTTVDLSSKADVPRPGSVQALGEIDSSADHFEQLSGSSSVSGSTLAAWRAEEIACERLRMEGEARTAGVRAGRFLTVSEYLRGADTKQYYVIEVTHEGTQTLETSPQTDAASYHATFIALPASVDPDNASDSLQFRPSRRTQVPQVTRLINGFIDIEKPGTPYEFAQPDAHGLYKVRFLFARQRYDGDKNSAYVRMATPYAGGTPSQGLSNAGMHFPLREGTEVLIAFLNGNPDRPVIVSALPNTEAPSMVTADNAGQHVIGTPGGNTMILADAQTGKTKSQPSIRLYSPVEESSLNLGTSDEEGVDNGWHLKTGLHGELYSGTSMLIEVPGHYRVAAGSDSNETQANFLGSEVQNLPSGISIGQSGGIVIENFLGMKIESVEAITVGNFFGAKAEMNEAGVFETTLGAKLAMEAVLSKEINLVEKNILHDSSNHTNALTSWITAKWNGVLAEKTEEIGAVTVTALETYKLFTPDAFLGSVASSLALEPAGATLTSEVITVNGWGTTTVTSTGTTTIEGGISTVNLTSASIAMDTNTLSVNASVAMEFSTGGDVSLNGTIITLG
jgi:type VI secretion system VgrG family protein